MDSENEQFQKPDGNVSDFMKRLNEIQDQVPSLSDAESIFANLLLKTDFTEEEISDVMDWQPDENEVERINNFVDFKQNLRENQKRLQSSMNTSYQFIY